MKTLNIGVLLGGTSSERDVSIASAVQVIRALRALGHQVWPLDTAVGWLTLEQEQTMFGTRVGALPPAGNTDPHAFLPAWLDLGKRRIDLWFLALHGGSGEDGRMQGLLEMTGIPYTGSGVLGSAMAMDKDVSKRLLRLAGVPTPDWLMAPVSPQEVEQVLGWPVVVKPSKQGSTVGLSVVHGPDELIEAVAFASRFDDEVMLERFIPGRELTCPVLGQEALAAGEIILRRGEVFDYEAKYQPGGAEEVFPAVLSVDETAEIRRLSLLAHRVLKLRGYSRTDFRLDPQGNFWCLEVNTLPGLTATSLLPQSAAVCGMAFDALVEKICREALQDEVSK